MGYSSLHSPPVYWGSKLGFKIYKMGAKKGIVPYILHQTRANRNPFHVFVIRLLLRNTKPLENHEFRPKHSLHSHKVHRYLNKYISI